MTHLPLTLGKYRTARGIVTIVHIGKHVKWAFDVDGRNKWHVETGEHFRNPSLNIIARHDPDAELAPAMVDDGLVVAVPLESWMMDQILDHWRQEVGKLHSQLDRVNLERDEAVALLENAKSLAPPGLFRNRCAAFLAKIEGE